MKTPWILAALGSLWLSPAEALSLTELHRSMRLFEGRDYVGVEVHRPDASPVLVSWYRDPRMTETVCRSLSGLYGVGGIRACSGFHSMIIASGEALARVRRLDDLDVGVDLAVALLGRAEAGGAVHQALDGPHSARRTLGERLSEGQALRGQPVGGEYAIDEADPLGLGGVDGLAAQQQLLGARDADQSGQALHAARAGKQAELHLGQREAGARAGQTQIAEQRQLEPAAVRHAVDRCHHGLRQRGELLGHADDVADLAAPALGIRRARELLDVGARGERPLARAGQHDGADRPGLGELVDERLEALVHRLAEDVERRVVEREDGDRADVLAADQTTTFTW